MTNEEIIRGLDSSALKDRGINAIEALFALINEKNKYIAELEAALVDKKQGKKYWSEAGLMKAKQVAEYLGFTYARVYELGKTGKLKMKRDDRTLIFFKDDVIAFRQSLEK